MRSRILAENFAASRWLTTADVARMLDRTTRGVRWIADQRQLTCERLRSGQRLFRKEDVERLVHERAEARLRRVTMFRPKRFGVAGEPRQMSLLGPTLKIVGGRNQPKRLPEAEVLRPRLFRKSA